MSERVSKLTAEVYDGPDLYGCFVGESAVRAMIEPETTEQGNFRDLDYSDMVPGGVVIEPKKPDNSFNLPA